jgi:quinol monooxygenase YgiN
MRGSSSSLPIARLRAQAGRVEELKAYLKAKFPQTRAFEGCRDITAYVDADDERSFVFVEHWDSRDAYQKYFAWRTETGVIAELLSMLDGAPRIRYFDAVDA